MVLIEKLALGESATSQVVPVTKKNKTTTTTIKGFFFQFVYFFNAREGSEVEKKAAISA